MFSRTLILTALLSVAALCVLSMPETASAATLVSVEDVTVDEGDSRLFRTVSVRISFSDAFHQRVTIVVALRSRPGRQPFPRLRAIQPLTTSRVLHGTGVTTIGILVRGDLDREPDEVADVRVTFAGLTRGGDVGVFTVRDDDHPTITVEEATALENGTGLTALHHRITASKAINQATALRVRALPGTAFPNRDFRPVDRIVTIPAHETTADVGINLIDDNIIDLEALKEYTLVVAPVNPGAIGVGGNLTARGRISDDEVAGGRELIFQLGDAALPELGRLESGCERFLFVDEPFNGPFDVRFKVTASAPSPLPFEILIFTENPQLPPVATAGEDYDPIERMFVFPANQRSMIFRIRFRDDNESEPDEGLRLVMRSPRMLGNVDTCGRGVGLNEVKIRGNLF